jgi:UDP:flavonoid glycosyltransferase YjiC (YdhE family)
MHVTVLALGSRGDVQPLLALALGLKDAGFDIRFAAPVDFEAWVRAQGLDFHPLTGRASPFFGGAAGSAMRDRLRDKRAFGRFFQDYLGTFLDKLLVSAWDACQDTDAILCWSWTRAGPSLAEKLGVPLFVVGATPSLHLPTCAFANPYQGPEPPPLGPLYNRLSWRWAMPFTRVGQQQVDRWRQETLGLPVIPWKKELRHLQSLPHLFGYSPSVLPKPWDWDKHVHVTGYWFLDGPADYRPDADLAAFLAAGKPPVAIGFSSQVGKDSRAMTAHVIDGVKKSGQRAIMIAGWGGFKGLDLDENILRVDSVPYDWLMPRVAAMVHQGGAGSTSAAARAGIPNVAITFGYDQALWGQRIARLGAGPRPIPATKLSADQFARALDQMLDNPGMAQAARALADRIANEDGVGTAVGIIERGLSKATVHPVRSGLLPRPQVEQTVPVEGAR